MALIRLEAITKIYDMGEVKIPALQGIDLKTDPGEMVAVLGHSGSGKSTLMNILGCLDRATSGRYSLDGQDVSQMSSNQLARIRNKLIGFVFQGFNLLPRTSAVENVQLPLLYSGIPLSESRKMAVTALQALGLGDRLYHHSTQLSGGQQQRVAISRAIVTNPRMILADEPTGNLDTITSLDVMTIFQDLNAKGITVILITHEMDIARYCHRTIVLKDGLIESDISNPSRDARSDRDAAVALRAEATIP